MRESDLKKGLKNLTSEQMEIINTYCANDMKLIRRITYPIIVKYGGFSEKDYDDFYDIALMCLMDSVICFSPDKNCTFHSYYIGNIKRKFMTEARDRQRAKRIPMKEIDSIHMIIGETGSELGELIPSDFDIFEETFGECKEEQYSLKMQKYLDNLSKDQYKICEMIIAGYKPLEIANKLHMSSKEYSDNMQAIKAYRNISILF